MKHVATVERMPGATGFGIAVFKNSEVPIGTQLFVAETVDSILTQQHTGRTEMESYMVFAGVSYYPSGGMEDFITDSSNLDTAITIARANYEGKGSQTWSHVYDTEERKEVWCSYLNGQ